LANEAECSGSMMAEARISIFLGQAVTGVSGWQESDIVAALLILVLGMALGIGLICFLLVLHSMRNGKVANRQTVWASLAERTEARLQLSLLPTPSRWLAVRSGNPHVVQVALGLHRPMPCTWEDGLSGSLEKKLFVSPAINGWVLVMGSHLPDPSDDVDRCFLFVSDLSRKLGQVQFFSQNRILNHHAWVHLQQGVVQRAYAWAGRTVWNQGPRSGAEIELGFRCFDYGQAPDSDAPAQSQQLQHNTERVCLLARRWSIDPNMIDARGLKESPGISGVLLRSRTQ